MYLAEVSPVDGMDTSGAIFETRRSASFPYQIAFKLSTFPCHVSRVKDTSSTLLLLLLLSADIHPYMPPTSTHASLKATPVTKVATTRAETGCRRQHLTFLTLLSSRLQCSWYPYARVRRANRTIDENNPHIALGPTLL